MSHLFCFGLGYSAERLAAQLAARGWRISGTAKTADGAACLRKLGYEGVVFDGTSAAADCARLLQSATHVLVSIPPGASGDAVLRWHAPDIAAAGGLRWIGYLSTVGVYGDRQGGWVDETTEPAPISDRSRHRLAAEQAWLQLGTKQNARVEIFRLAGIYGPGRSVVDQLRQGTAKRIVKPGQVFNRIHVDDVAATLAAAMAAPSRHAIYNVADDEPADSEAVMLYAAGLLHMAPPPAIPFGQAELSPMAQSFYAECKRVSNRRIKTALGIKLLYPSYREGLRAIAIGST
jgi:nucleoside-diphosphate-sugar epimerase